ncbi:3-oxo-tetronate 4-phosphate decarboxylase [bioreactor metagenome]|uniref:3-oxo-tetronate 4-phosphate decarboxylase n=1 Tax=bioreactor metagenome TaxID=1076179 RepID=A0A645B348_9ZZZZ
MVIHTHSFYATLVSCLNDKKTALSDLLSYTPYLQMKTNGQIKSVEYYKPGSKELFNKFNSIVANDTNAYILSNHGIIVTSKDIIKAFNIIEEFEISSRILCRIENYTKDDYMKIV